MNPHEPTAAEQVLRECESFFGAEIDRRATRGRFRVISEAPTREGQNVADQMRDRRRIRQRRRDIAGRLFG